MPGPNGGIQVVGSEDDALEGGAGPVRAGQLGVNLLEPGKTRGKFRQPEEAVHQPLVPFQE
jgi:hypothetical protein